MIAQGAPSALGILALFAGLFGIGGWLSFGDPPKPFTENTDFYLAGPLLQTGALFAAVFLLWGLWRDEVLQQFDKGLAALWSVGCLSLGLTTLILFMWAASRYLFGLSAWPPQGWPLSLPETWWMELSFGLFGLSLTVGIPFLLRRGGHVGIDVIEERITGPARRWIHTIGNLLLALPVGLLIMTKGSSFAARAWDQLEASQNFGIGFVFLIKTLVPLMGFLIASAALANILDRSEKA